MAAFLFSTSHKPTTPDRLRLYHDYRQHPVSGFIPPTSAYEESVPLRSSFLTHGNSRVYPLTVMGSYIRPQSVDKGQKRPEEMRPGTQAQDRRGGRRGHEQGDLNMSVDSAIPVEIPRVQYQEFRRMHQQRQNNTTPGKRLYGDYHTSDNVDVSKRFYRPQTVRITPRSKIILHSSFPIALPVPVTAIKRPQRGKSSSEAPQLIEETFESPVRGEVLSPTDDAPAFTFADKLAKLKKVADFNID